VAPTLAKLEAELAAALEEHHDAIVARLARILVEMAVQEHYGNELASGPKLCASCRVTLAAPQRTVCHSCRRRQRNERARLRQALTDEREAALAGERGERARQLVAGERQNPAPFVAG
jgi:hypothetical protein